MKAENYTLNHDLHLFYISASSFPQGIAEAHNKLHALLPSVKDRNFFGLSRPEKDVIAYKAAVEEKKPGEGKTFDCASLTLPKGIYTSCVIHDYHKDVTVIQRTFDQLLHHPQLDPQGYCVEMYLNEKDVRCMVRLADK